MRGRIIEFSIGKPKQFDWKGKKEISAIGKIPLEEASLTPEGFAGDGVANSDFHGGPDRAVCLYPYEHYSMWEKEFGKPLQPPAFGENICAENMKEEDVFIGDIFALGDAVIQITQGRVPCSTISKFNEADQLLARIVETGFTGYFFRVIEPGMVRKDSQIILLERKQEEISVLEGNEIFFRGRKNAEAMEKMLRIEALADVWKTKLQKALYNIT
ncbi:MOSC domain-containing protein [Bacillus infantis]|uniref:MOSC domain-containing protein n=1 Tax=Bacillus infantis TaxID=324767 RepID=UPI003CF94C8B